MSNVTRGVYRERGGRLNCRHGLLIYGGECSKCEREAESATGQGEQQAWARDWDRRRVPLSTDAYVEEVMRRRAEEIGRRRDDAAEAFIYGYAGGRSHWQDTATRNPVEIITDPRDHRGLNAKPVRRAA